MFSYIEEDINPTTVEVSGFRITGKHGAPEPMNPEERWRSRASERETERQGEREHAERHAKHLTSQHHRDQFDFTTSSTARSHSELKD